MLKSAGPRAICSTQRFRDCPVLFLPSAVFSGMLFAPGLDVAVPVVALAPFEMGFFRAVKLRAFGVLAFPIPATVTAALFTVFGPFWPIALNGGVAMSESKFLESVFRFTFKRLPVHAGSLRAGR